MNEKIESLPNMRDFSSYANRDGYHIKPHKLFRSETLFNLSEKDFHKLFDENGYNIKTVIDLRNDFEISKKPNILLANKSDIKRFNICLSDEKYLEKVGFMGGIDEFIDKYSTSEFDAVAFSLYKQYVSNDFSKNAMKNIFEVLLENRNTPILFHCISGKDRTGFLTAIIMLALGFNEKDIVEEYLLSNERRLEYNARKFEKAKISGKNENYIEKFKRFTLVSKANIDTVLNEIRRLFGSNENYFAEIGLTKENLNKLKSIYLEKDKNPKM